MHEGWCLVQDKPVGWGQVHDPRGTWFLVMPKCSRTSKDKSVRKVGNSVLCLDNDWARTLSDASLARHAGISYR